MKSVLSKNALRGIGSILDIMPPQRATKKKIRKKVIKSEQARMNDAWRQVGVDVHKAIGQYDNGQKAL